MPCEREHGFLGAKACGIDAAHLTGSDADGLAVARVDDGVGFDVLADAPGEDQGAKFLGCGWTPGDDFEFVFRDAARVGVLQEQTAGDVLDDRPLRCGANFNEAEVLLWRRSAHVLRG